MAEEGIKQAQGTPKMGLDDGGGCMPVCEE